MAKSKSKSKNRRRKKRQRQEENKLKREEKNDQRLIEIHSSGMFYGNYYHRNFMWL